MTHNLSHSFWSHQPTIRFWWLSYGTDICWYYTVVRGHILSPGLLLMQGNQLHVLKFNLCVEKNYIHLNWNNFHAFYFTGIKFVVWLHVDFTLPLKNSLSPPLHTHAHARTPAHTPTRACTHAHPHAHPRAHTHTHTHTQCKITTLEGHGLIIYCVPT
jgi:hypothetical protein